MAKKNLLLFAGAALAAAACSLFLSRGAREFLFGVLSREGETKDSTESEAMQIANTPGPEIRIASEDESLSASWKTGSTPLDVITWLSENGNHTAVCELVFPGQRRPVSGSIGRLVDSDVSVQPTLARITTDTTDYFIETSADASDGRAYVVGLNLTGCSVATVRALYEQTTGVQLSPGTADSIEKIIQGKHG